MQTKERLVLGALAFSSFLLAWPTVCLAQEPERFRLSPHAQQAARIMGIEPLLARLSILSAARGASSTGMSLEELALHQQITEAVVAASLDVDSVVDRIDYERAQIVELQSILLARRQRALGSTNLATLALSTGLGAVSGVLQFSDTTKGVGNAIGFAAGGLSTLLSIRSLRQQHSGARPAWALPSMLAPLLTDPRENSVYPAEPWAYLNSAPEGGASQASRREQLLAGWLTAGRFLPLDSPQSKSKVALLTGTDAADKKLSMDLLSERAAMLADVHDEIAVMKRALAEIVRSIRASR